MRLIHTSDRDPGYTRRRCGRGFTYLDTQGKRITSSEVRVRIQQLAIPPAYENVWICPEEFGHLQATGFDGRRRKQYRYHPLWREFRNQSKFQQMLDFAECLPRIRRKLSKDLQLRNLEKDRVVATAIRLIDHTGARVGNDEYTETNGTFGITTLQGSHLTETRDKALISYKGKGGASIELTISSTNLVKAIHRCSELPGERLFQYRGTDSELHPVRSQDVNEYLEKAANFSITAKDFRTWKASVVCFASLSKMPVDGTSKNQRIRLLNDAIKETAKHLNHTPSTCRKFYIHPAVVEYFERGEKLEGASRFNPTRAPRYGLSSMEESFLAFLEASGTDHGT